MNLECDGVSVRYGRNGTFTWPLRGVSLRADRGTLAITGPSGSGKSTLLRVLSGRQQPTEGTVTLGGSPVAFQSGRSPGDPRIAMIHQDYRLIPFLSVAENLLFAAEMSRASCDSARISDLLELVGLGGFEDYPPDTLSGGEQQRVAIARALVSRPAALLADEPTGALDGDNTRRVSSLLTRIAQEEDVVVIVVTHDPLVSDAMARTLELHDGRLTGEVLSAR
jgi:putative ABC transport system ATP-binding protein